MFFCSILFVYYIKSKNKLKEELVNGREKKEKQKP